MKAEITPEQLAARKKRIAAIFAESSPRLTTGINTASCQVRAIGPMQKLNPSLAESMARTPGLVTATNITEGF
jgi:hypothetical protein